MSDEKPVKGRTRLTPQQRQLGSRALIAASALWGLGVFVQPMGLPRSLHFGSLDLRFKLSYALALLSFLAIATAFVIYRPWRRRGGKSRAILLLCLALALGNIYLLSWLWRA